MGKSSQPTIGYWYLLLLHFGWGRGPLDALLEMRGGEKTAWQGEQTVSGTISINAPDLWGGEKAEGGIVGDFDVMMGEPTQAPNAYLAANLGAQQTAYRGKSSGVFKGGKWGAFNPYPKPGSWKLRRIYKGWDDDACWYPETAGIVIGDVGQTPVGWQAEGYQAHLIGQKVEVLEPLVGQSDFTIALANQYGVPYYPPEPGAEIFLYFWRPNESNLLYSKRLENTSSNIPTVQNLIDRGWQPDTTALIQYWNITDLRMSVYTLGAGSSPPPAPSGYVWIEGSESPMSTSEGWVRLWATEFLGESAVALTGTLIAMNPAHMLYMSIVGLDFQGEPAAMVNSASLTAAADTLYAERFGLCTTYDPTQETVEQFQQRICNVIGGSLSQSRVDGQYYLTLIRGDYVLDDLPILGDDDILEYEEEPSDPLESVNQVTVGWFDPQKKEKRATTPLQSLGAIMATGGIIAETAQYPEIPYEDLALRVAARDLSHKANPLKRFKLTTNRIPYAWRAGQFFRLQAPRRGIADMVCQVGEIDAGTPRSGTMQLVAIQDVSGMPSTVYVVAEPGVDTSEPQTATLPEAQQILEVPYANLAAALSTADLAALAADAGYMLAVAKRGSTGINYTLYTGANAEPLEERGSGDWCPTGLVVEACAADEGDVTDFTLSNFVGLAQVSLGTAALWGSELVRVDALDTTTGAITLGRGVGDCVPSEHAAGERIWFYQESSATDAREYVDGEVVHAKLLTRTATQLLSLAVAPDQTVTMDQRAARPYPPGNLQLNGGYYLDHFNGLLTVSWAHRDRLLQADQWVDSTAANVGPEAGTTYRLRLYDEAGALVVDDATLTGTSYLHSTEGTDTLLHFDGSDGSTSFPDLSGKIWTAFGQAQVDTAQSKFGGASALFDGSGDYLSTPNHSDFDFGTGDFTIECWARYASTTGQQALISNTQDATHGFSFQKSTAHKLIFNCTGNTADITGATTLVAGQWYHLAVSRVGTALKLFVDGVQDASVVDSQSITSTAPCNISYSSATHNGWIDDLRVTKGVGRYTGNFTPPTAAFPDDVGVLSAQVRVRLGALRDGLASWQEHDLTVPRSGYGFAYGQWYDS